MLVYAQVKCSAISANDRIISVKQPSLNFLDKSFEQLKCGSELGIVWRKPIVSQNEENQLTQTYAG